MKNNRQGTVSHTIGLSQDPKGRLPVGPLVGHLPPMSKQLMTITLPLSKKSQSLWVQDDSFTLASWKLSQAGVMKAGVDILKRWPLQLPALRQACSLCNIA